MECRTLSQINGRLYSPIYFFRLGLFTLMHIASFVGCKIHKKDIPLRPLVSCRGSMPFGVTKELVRILKSLVGKSIHHVNNTKEFAEQIRNIKLEEGECITSYDVTASFTAVPVASAIDIIKNWLEQDTELPSRTIMSANTTIELLGFCLSNT